MEDMVLMRDEPAIRHAKYALVPEGKIAFFRKRYADEVNEEIQRVKTTMHWEQVEGWPTILFSRILSDHQIEDLLLEEKALENPIEILAIESGKGLFVKRPGHAIVHYHQTFAQMKKRLLRHKKQTI
jgi:hypothetical protein